MSADATNTEVTVVEDTAAIRKALLKLLSLDDRSASSYANADDLQGSSRDGIGAV
jgi:FixJ family two-component response regulator